MTYNVFGGISPTSSECVYLVMRGHFQLRDKDGGHTIGFAIAEFPYATHRLCGNVL